MDTADVDAKVDDDVSLSGSAFASPSKTKVTPERCEHRKRALDPHSLCEHCKRSYNVEFCTSDKRCDQCDKLDLSVFELFIKGRETNLKRNQKKKDSPRKPKVTLQRDVRKSPRDHVSHYSDENVDTFEEVVPEDESESSALLSLAHSMNVNPANLQALLSQQSVQRLLVKPQPTGMHTFPLEADDRSLSMHQAAQKDAYDEFPGYDPYTDSDGNPIDSRVSLHWSFDMILV